MKKIIFLLNIFITQNILSQCIVDAGNNTHICIGKFNQITNSVQLSPRMIQGVKPVEIRWEAKYYLTSSIYFTASSFLNDTTILNPTFIKGINGFNNKYVTFYIYIKDSLNNQCSDSLKIRLSSFAFTPDLTNKKIKLGDSIQLYSLIGGGIPPLKYIWTPYSKITNNLISNPKVYPNIYTEYTCNVSDSLGCISDFTNTWYIDIDLKNSIEDINLKPSFIKNYHNPISENSIFELNTSSNISKIEIYNSLGQRIYSQKSTDKLEIGTIVKEKGEYFILTYDIDGHMNTFKVQRQ